MPSVNPRKYDQSCIRLCIAKRFVTAAKMSFPVGMRFVGLQPGGFDAGIVCQAFVHGKMYSRVTENGFCPADPESAGSPRLGAVGVVTGGCESRRVRARVVVPRHSRGKILNLHLASRDRNRRGARRRLPAPDLADVCAWVVPRETLVPD